MASQDSPTSSPKTSTSTPAPTDSTTSTATTTTATTAMSTTDQSLTADAQKRDMDKMAKGWSIAMRCSWDRLKRVHNLDDAQLDEVTNKGHLILETVCLFVHSCVKSRQYLLPAEFWRLLHSQYGVVVYPSALTETIDVDHLGVDFTFSELYDGHIVMHQGCHSRCASRCPFQDLQEPPPPYEADCPRL